MTPQPPIFYSFRRCPYAIRARLALHMAQVELEHREILLKDKPPSFLEASPSASVPCVVTEETVIDESLDIMIWALNRHDPLGLLDMPADDMAWIARNDGPFKQALDQTKYPNRSPNADPNLSRAQASEFLADLNANIDGWLLGKQSLADYAILPFVRQFAFIDKAWFDAQPWPSLQAWLERFLASARFAQVMEKRPVWQDPTRAFVDAPA